MNKVPQETWSGMPCSVSHLGVFGCVLYSHVAKVLRGKLDDKSEKHIFIGYSEHSKSYYLYNPITNKTIINNDVVFKEQESWKGSVDKIVDVRVSLMEEEDVTKNE